MAILVTGGTGFIGRILVRRLVSRGDDVHLLARATSELSEFSKLNIRIFPGDITDKESLRKAMAGCAQVFHLAAFAQSFTKDRSTYFQVNVEGSRNVLSAALENAADRVVFASTSVTIGPSSDEAHDENSKRDNRFFHTEYERSKYLAEKMALEYVRHGLPVVIVNPTRVYGPGKLTEANSVTRMVQSYLRPRICPILGKGREIGNYVFVDDVVEGFLLAMSRGRAGERYILGGENISLLGFYRLLRKVTRKKALRLYVPDRLALTIGRFEEWRAHHWGASPLITREWVNNFLVDWSFSNQKARDGLGCRFRSLEEGLSITVAWLKSGQKRTETDDA
jgi:nucleoside-diphosphate-sugar epimerase